MEHFSACSIFLSSLALSTQTLCAKQGRENQFKEQISTAQDLSLDSMEVGYFSRPVVISILKVCLQNY